MFKRKLVESPSWVTEDLCIILHDGLLTIIFIFVESLLHYLGTVLFSDRNLTVILNQIHQITLDAARWLLITLSGYSIVRRHLSPSPHPSLETVPPVQQAIMPEQQAKSHPSRRRTEHGKLEVKPPEDYREAKSAVSTSASKAPNETKTIDQGRQNHE